MLNETSASKSGLDLNSYFSLLTKQDLKNDLKHRNQVPLFLSQTPPHSKIFV